jgi:hypothetical protein
MPSDDTTVSLLSGGGGTAAGALECCLEDTYNESKQV